MTFSKPLKTKVMQETQRPHLPLINVIISIILKLHHGTQGVFAAALSKFTESQNNLIFILEKILSLFTSYMYMVIIDTTVI